MRSSLACSASLSESWAYYNAHRVNEFVGLDEVEELIGYVKYLLQAKQVAFPIQING